MASTSSFTGDPKQYPIEQFKEEITGSCNCGAITVIVKDNLWANPEKGHLCHCQNCRKTSGSFVTSNMAMEKAKVEIRDEQGKLKRYPDYNTGSGKKVERCFCGECGSAIMSDPELFPDLVMLKTGMFPRIPKPECESFVGHRQSWEEQSVLGSAPVLFDTVRGQAKFEGK
ncbi:unnamed protein product [Periconia digitata]|uniref:CENP-V/GFA domain-containing protein n=1 Tax=Periconia digitata TaxID=1303443 RepID=A0A9W4UEV9_9PLEO|nr:unnamed protein product [Periconia digitata]